jgi:hypothetical protein
MKISFLFKNELGNLNSTMLDRERAILSLLLYLKPLLRLTGLQIKHRCRAEIG